MTTSIFLGLLLSCTTGPDPAPNTHDSETSEGDSELSGVPVRDEACAISTDRAEDATFLRDDIAFCQTTELKTLEEAWEVCNRSAHWHVCKERELVERNSAFTAPTGAAYVGRLDAGDDCALRHDPANTGDTAKASIDRVWAGSDTHPGQGSCDESIVSETDTVPEDHPDGAQVGYAGRRTDDDLERTDSTMGVVCCW